MICIFKLRWDNAYHINLTDEMFTHQESTASIVWILNKNLSSLSVVLDILIKNIHNLIWRKLVYTHFFFFFFFFF